MSHPFRASVAKIIRLSAMAVTSAMGRDLPLDASRGSVSKGRDSGHSGRGSIPYRRQSAIV